MVRQQAPVDTPRRDFPGGITGSVSRPDLHFLPIHAGKQKTLKVSVVIPTKNRSGQIAQTIEHIESQTIPRDQYEVIVIDNDSADDTRKVLEQRARTYSNLKFGLEEKPGAAATRNTGIRMAKGELVVFIDDDVQAEPGLIQAHLQYHQKNPGAAVDAALKVKPDLNRQSTLEQLQVDIELLDSPNSKGRIGWGAQADWDQTLDLLKKYRDLKTTEPWTAFHTNEFVTAK